jgi:hypothetical protein
MERLFGKQKYCEAKLRNEALDLLDSELLLSTARKSPLSGVRISIRQRRRTIQPENETVEKTEQMYMHKRSSNPMHIVDVR